MPESRSFEKTYRNYPFAELVRLGTAAGEIYGRRRRGAPSGARPFRRGLAALRLRGLLGRSDTAAVDRILAGAGMRRAELFARSRLTPGRRRRMAEMMRCFRVDVDVATRHHWAALCVAERSCARCPEQERCRAWLAGQGDHDAPRVFCPNSGIFDRLAAAGRLDHAPRERAA